MSDEHDSWFQSAFGLDLGGSLKKIEDEAKAMANQAADTVKKVVQDARSRVEEGIDGLAKGAAAVAKKVAGAASGAVGGATAGSTGAGGATAGGGTGSFPLGGSVGRGGKNAPNDVRAVQTALGIAADGNCGSQTIRAIEAFQRTIGQARPDGRVDAGGATEKALASGAKGSGATPPTPVPPSDAGKTGADEGILGGLAKRAGELVDDAKNLGKNVVEGVTSALDGPAVDLGGMARTDTGSAAKPGLVDSLLGIGVGAQFSLPSVIAHPRDPGFPIGTVAFGQFAAKLSGKFKPTLASATKPTNPAEAEAGVKAICKEIYDNATVNWFGGVKIKGDKKSVGVAASLLKVSTTIGEVSLEVSAFEIGLDAKKLVKASVGSSSANYPVFEREVNGVKYEIALSIGGALEISPNPAFLGGIAEAGAEATVGSALLTAIDVALVAGPPLAAAAILGVAIVMAGEKGALHRSIIEGAIDTRQAARSYASNMMGSAVPGTGPRAQAAVALARSELGKVASKHGVPLEDLMTELRVSKHQAADFQRVHAQARQQFFAAYFSEVRRVIRAWRKEHSILAAFTTEADDIIAASKLVHIQFEKS